LVLTASAFVRGMNRSLRDSGSDANVILLGAGSEESFERSEILPSVPGLVQASVPGILSRLGVAYVSPEVYLMTQVRENRDAMHVGQIIVRGVTPAAFLVHAHARIAEGRAPLGGSDEIVVGRLAGAKLGLSEENLAVGKTLWFDDRAWTIVGRLEAPGTVMESEIWAPLTELQIAARRDNLSCVVVTMRPGADLDDVDSFARQRLDLELVAMRETDYYAKLSAFYRPIQATVFATAALIALGGLLGGLNTMYAAVAARVREIGTLQVLGFPRRAIVLSLIQESLLTTIAGTLIASVIALVALDGVTVQFSAGAFGLVIDSGVLLAGVGAGVVLGVVGAVPPAVRCLKIPVVEALRAV
jgi:ABC-type antimicrobial peptide transport system permease subunit